jgi:hypothetical protein
MMQQKQKVGVIMKKVKSEWYPIIIFDFKIDCPECETLLDASDMELYKIRKLENEKVSCLACGFEFLLSLEPCVEKTTGEMIKTLKEGNEILEDIIKHNDIIIEEQRKLISMYEKKQDDNDKTN